MKKILMPLLVLCGLSAPLRAEVTLNANVPEDVVDMEGCTETHCSLREAVLAANASQDPQVIINLTVDDAPYVLSIPGADDTGEAGDLDLLSNLPNDGTKSVTIVGLGANVTTIDATPLQVAMDPDRVFHVPQFLDEVLQNFLSLTLQDLTVTGGSASVLGGAILVVDNPADFVALTVNNCDIVGNDVIEDGGGIAVVKDNADLLPILTVVINNSLVRENTAGNNGGGLFLLNASAQINNSTLTANDAAGGGGALYVTSADSMIDVFINSSTITANNSGTAIVVNQAETGDVEVALTNTILTGNAGDPTECATIGEMATIVSNGFNVFGDLTGCTLTATGDDQVNITPATIFAGALADNGGPTQTFALLLDGEAVDAGNPEGCFNGNGDPADANNTELLSDQRVDAALFPRISGAACDVGAFELRQEADLSTVKTANTETADVGDEVTYTITVTNNGPAVANNVLVTDALPAQLEFVSVDPADPTCTFDNVSQKVECTIEKMQPGESTVITIVATIVSEGNGVITNTATAVPGNETDPDPDNSSSSVDINIGGGFLQGSGEVIGCSLNTLATSSSASWLWMASALGLFFAGLRSRRS